MGEQDLREREKYLNDHDKQVEKELRESNNNFKIFREANT